MAFIFIVFVNRLMTLNALDTFIPVPQLDIGTALRAVIGIALIPMISKETMMNAVDYALTDGPRLIWWIAPIMLTAGFVTPLPYRYGRLKALRTACQ